MKEHVQTILISPVDPITVEFKADYQGQDVLVDNAMLNCAKDLLEFIKFFASAKPTYFKEGNADVPGYVSEVAKCAP